VSAALNLIRLTTDDLCVDTRDSADMRDRTPAWVLLALGILLGLLVLLLVLFFSRNVLRSECGGFSCGARSSVSTAPGP